MHLSPVELEERGRQVISNVPFSHSFIRYTTLNLSQCFLMKQDGLRERQSSNREHDRFYFICMLLFNSNFPAHLLRADVCMCVCMYVCKSVCMHYYHY